jgi:hypothetical protein
MWHYILFLMAVLLLFLGSSIVVWRLWSSPPRLHRLVLGHVGFLAEQNYQLIRNPTCAHEVAEHTRGYYARRDLLAGRDAQTTAGMNEAISDRDRAYALFCLAYLGFCLTLDGIYPKDASEVAAVTVEDTAKHIGFKKQPVDNHVMRRALAVAFEAGNLDVAMEVIEMWFIIVV